LRKTIPLIITFASGTLILVDFLFKIPRLSGSSQIALNWSIIVAAFATALGGANLLRIHTNRVREQKENWQLSIVLLAVMVFFIVLGTVIEKPSGKNYQFFWSNLLQPLSATLFSANAFFITSAAYRAFRVKTAEAAVLMVAALIVMFGNIGVGRAIWSEFPALGSWIMKVPNAAGMRGITIGAALGAISISLRVLLGFERSHFGGE
jgi:cytochrome bd-type quinol oxidase subunit 2